MHFLRFTKDVFGQKMLVGVNWDYLWVPVAAAGAIVALHFILRTLRRRS